MKNALSFTLKYCPTDFVLTLASVAAAPLVLVLLRSRLTIKVIALLAYLATNAGRVLMHTQILEHVWGPGYKDETQNLRVYVSQLRRKLTPIPFNLR